MPSEVKEKGVRQHSHHLVAPGAVFLLLFVAMFLYLGMGQQVVEAIDLGLLLLRRQRLAVLLEQAGNVPIFGLERSPSPCCPWGPPCAAGSGRSGPGSWNEARSSWRRARFFAGRPLDSHFGPRPGTRPLPLSSRAASEASEAGNDLRTKPKSIAEIA